VLRLQGENMQSNFSEKIKRPVQILLGLRQDHDCGERLQKRNGIVENVSFFQGAVEEFIFKFISRYLITIMLPDRPVESCPIHTEGFFGISGPPFNCSF